MVPTVSTVYCVPATIAVAAIEAGPLTMGMALAIELATLPFRLQSYLSRKKPSWFAPAFTKARCR